MKKDSKKKKSDYLLELALEEQLKHDVEMNKYKSGDEVDSPHVFSMEHNMRMKKIFNIAVKAEKKNRRIKIYHQVAAVFILLLCMSAFSVTQVEAFRIPVMRFFMELKEKSTFLGASNENDTGLTENYRKYEPYYVPAGFSVMDVHEEKGKFNIKYLNEKKQQGYRYYFFDSIENVAIDTEEGNAIEINIKGNQAYIIQKGKEIRILMYKDNNQFYIAGTISYEEAIKIMESIK